MSLYYTSREAKYFLQIQFQQTFFIIINLFLITKNEQTSY